MSLSIKNPSGLIENPLPKFKALLNSNFPVESDLVETNDNSSYDIIWFPPSGRELKAVWSSNLLAFVLEKTQDPPS
jgi:hypothetical protein